MVTKVASLNILEDTDGIGGWWVREPGEVLKVEMGVEVTFMVLLVEWYSRCLNSRLRQEIETIYIPNMTMF